MRRRKSREFALQILFSLENQEVLPADGSEVQLAVISYLENFAPKNFEEISDLPYLQRLLAGILSDLPALDAELEKHSEHWKLYRMTRIDRNILRIGAEELKSFKDIPPKVSLDECVELAKRFGTDESSAFVNGILDKVSHSLGRGES
jgi:transcription antitermination protein NusB